MAEQTLSVPTIYHGLTVANPTNSILAQLGSINPVHALNSGISHLNDFTITILDSNLNLISEVVSNTFSGYVSAGSSHELRSAGPVLSTGGGTHDNTEWMSYSGQDYLKCRHLYGNLTGTYTSPIFDIGAESSNRHLIYIIGEDTGETDIVIVGEGTTWDDKMPSPTTWNGVNISTDSWSEIFDLPGAPSVKMRLYYGSSSPPTNYVDRMEILSAIIPASNQYFQVRIQITDPSEQVFAYVEAYTLKFTTYS